MPASISYSVASGSLPTGPCNRDLSSVVSCETLATLVASTCNQLNPPKGRSYRALAQRSHESQAGS